jgi:hypothetical protein
MFLYTQKHLTILIQSCEEEYISNFKPGSEQIILLVSVLVLGASMGSSTAASVKLTST